MVLKPKYYNIDGIWALNPYYLGPCTLRVRECHPVKFWYMGCACASWRMRLATRSFLGVTAMIPVHGWKFS